MELITGAEILVRCLKEEGVEYLFGYPGGSVLHIYDALYLQDDVKHVLVRHEQAAGHAADGYARASGKPGVVLVTSGPGVTNAVTGIATAYMDSIPLVVFTGQVPTALIGNDAFQEVDMVGITRPCVKHNYLVKDVTKIWPKRSRRRSISPLPAGPARCWWILPKDVTIAKAEFHYPKKIKLRSYNPTIKGHAGQIRKAVDLILSAKRPMIYAGGGVILSDGSTELVELAQCSAIPITTTLMGLGAFPATDPQFIGMLGMHGTYEANMAMHECDVLIAIGARFDDRVTGKIEQVLPGRQDRSRGYRPLLDFQERPRRYSHRRFGAARAAGDDQRDPRRETQVRQRGAGALVAANRRLAGDEIAELSQQRGSDQAAVRDREAVSGDRRRGHHHHRRGPASDVGGPVLSRSTGRASGSIPADWARWASACRRRWAPSSPSPTRTWPASPATAASR